MACFATAVDSHCRTRGQQQGRCCENSRNVSTRTRQWLVFALCVVGRGLASLIARLVASLATGLVFAFSRTACFRAVLPRLVPRQGLEPCALDLLALSIDDRNLDSRAGLQPSGIENTPAKLPPLSVVNA